MIRKIIVYFLPINKQPFENIWKNTQVNNKNSGVIAYNLMKNTNSLFEKLNIKYFLIYGTLLGCVRHNGVIPWDDDMDIAIDKKSFDNLNNYKKIFKSNNLILAKSNSKYWKVFPDDVPLIRNLKWGWPFIDLFWFDIRDDKTIISDNITDIIVNNDTKYETKDIFPLIKKNYNFIDNYSLELYIPNNYRKVLDILYKNWETICMSSPYNHRIEKPYKKAYKVNCNNLYTVNEDIFDNVYIINLDNRPDRYQSCIDRLKTIDIIPKRWEATNTNSIKTFYDNIQGKKKNIGEVACYFSHKLLWKYLYDKKVPYAIIFEDDIIFTKNVNKTIILKEINNSYGFDIIFLGHCYGNKNDTNLPFIGTARCLHAYVVTHESLKKLLDKPIDMNEPVDGMTYNLCKNDLLCFLSQTDKDKGKKMDDDGIFFQDSNLGTNNPK